MYQDTPQWVPPLSSEMPFVLNQKRHPFYQHSTAQFFYVENDGLVVGRIAILHHKNYSAFHQEETAFFYYFESINDQKVANLLFDGAVNWCQENNIKKIVGPKGFLRSDGQGILVEGFEFLPAVGIPYNLDYYDRLITNYGFTKLTDHLSGYFSAQQKLPEKLHLFSEKIKQNGKFWVLSFHNKKQLEKWIPEVNKVHHEAFQNNPNFYPSTDKEFELLAANIIQIANPDLIKLIMFNHKVAGFLICYPNINQAIQEINGKIFPLGWIKLLRAKSKLDQVDLNGVGLLPEYQGRGANILLYTEIEETLRKNHVQVGEFVQIDEQNFRSRSDMETIGINWSKKHRTYVLNLDEQINQNKSEKYE